MNKRFKMHDWLGLRSARSWCFADIAGHIQCTVYILRCAASGVGMVARNQERTTTIAIMSITQAIDAKEILPVAHEVSSQATKPVPSEVIESEVHGFKLWSIMIAIILACFLMLLDVAVLSTVSPQPTLLGTS